MKRTILAVTVLLTFSAAAKAGVLEQARLGINAEPAAIIRPTAPEPAPESINIQYTPVLDVKYFEDFKASLAGAARSTVKDNEPVALDCASSPGIMLCRKFTSAGALLNYTCHGSPCIALWNGIAEELNGIASMYISLPPVNLVKENIGLAARDLAKLICSTGASAGIGNIQGVMALSKMVLAKNTVMTPLVELQTKAGLSPVSECSFTVTTGR
ncbi:MAG: hypothetical protein A2234_10515 [Elusimicrobia bacterium RIFOXYA2_FULL_58_8]|nr:MAG: hypothetical protein A2285_09665 [Elusimicrobia bacterium RIFOXYA12_FULL_57_11]OGS14847.1 MAG: hypothetical protein A2234_10515 [Elusimicrobia bacterium RIFOXYA2_FULL_58_8]